MVKSAVMARPAMPDVKKLSREEVIKKIERMRARDHEMVTGIFKNFEFPGTSVRFGLKKWPGDPYDFYEMFDGETYKVPRMVATHLNQNCCYLEYKQLGQTYNGETLRMGHPDGKYQQGVMQMARKVFRFGFMPTDFSDDSDMMQTNIVEVSSALGV